MQVQKIAQLVLDGRVKDGAGDLHPAAEVPGHQVRRRDEILRVRPPAKDVDSGVLQIPPDDAGDLDVLRLVQHPRPQAADAADNELDLNARLGRLAQFVNDLTLRDGVDLEAEVPLWPFGDLLVDER